MEDPRYSIEVPIHGLGQYTLCKCDTPDTAAEVIKLLLAQKARAYDWITVRIAPDTILDTEQSTNPPFG